MARWRWRAETEPRSPDKNMAIDAALLGEVRDTESVSPIVRVYHWDRDCVSVGRLQDPAGVAAAYPGLPLVLRPTGGRAVRHGQDVTVSVAARLGDLPPSESTSVAATYRLIAGGVIDALCALGVPVEFGATRGRERSGPVDCFGTVSRCDIVDQRDGRKLVGCAQRREGTALLQQMSLPLATLPRPDAFPGCLRQALAVRLGVTEWQEASFP